MKANKIFLVAVAMPALLTILALLITGCDETEAVEPNDSNSFVGSIDPNSELVRGLNVLYDPNFYKAKTVTTEECKIDFLCDHKHLIKTDSFWGVQVTTKGDNNPVTLIHGIYKCSDCGRTIIIHTAVALKKVFIISTTEVEEVQNAPKEGNIAGND